jgi:HK97 family phage major capsid protein
MQRLAGDFQALTDQYDAILNRAVEENRDPTDDEAGLLDGLRSEMTPLGERLVELRETDDRRMAAVRAMGEAPTLGGGSTADVVAGAGAAVPGRRSQVPPLQVGETQLRAIVEAVQTRQAYNEPVENRAASLTPAGAVVPVWWPPVEYGVEARLAEVISTRPAPETGNEFDYLATTTAAVLGDVAEGAAKPDAGLVLSRRHVTLDKGAAHTDYSWELQSDFEGIDAIINNELAAGLIRWENTKIVAGIAADPGILAPTIVGTNPGLVQVFQAAMAVRGAPNVGNPDLVVLHPSDWYQLTTELAATSGLFLSGTQVVSAGPEPTLWGMKVALTIAQTAGQCLLGVAAAAAWFMREGPRVIVDPYSQAVNNLTRMIYEERGAPGLLVPGRWAKFTFTGALAAEADEKATAKK